MRLSTSIKLALLVPVVFSTWFVTRGLLAGIPMPGSRPLAQELAKEGVPAQAGQIRDAAVSMTYEYRITGSQVAIDGNKVSVSTTAEMTDRVGDKVYLWRLGVFREGVDQAVSDVFYEGQAFSIHPSGKMTPTFSETLELPLGKYQMFLTLYALPPGYDASQLKDETNSRQATVLRNAQTVEVK